MPNVVHDTTCCIVGGGPAGIRPGPAKAPWQLKFVFQIPGISRVLARAVGMGVLPEHVEAVRPPCDKAATLKRVAIGVGLLAAGTFLAVRWLSRRRLLTS
jgi:hypothetical protein